MIFRPIAFVPFLALLIFGCGDEKTNPTKPSAGGADLEDSLGVFTDRILVNPADLSNYIARANYFTSKNELDKAANDVENILSRDSTYAPAWLLRGKLSYAKNAFREAKDNFEACVHFNPEDIDCNLRLAELELLLKNYKNALGYINTALKGDPYRSAGYEMKGRLYAETGDSTLAYSSYQTAIDLEPDDFDNYIVLGGLYAKVNNDLAIDLYNSALAINENSPEALYAKALYLQETGYRDTARYTQSFEIYDLLIEKNPAFSAAYFNKGFVQAEYLNNQELAIDEYTKAIQTYPTYFQAFYNRGLCLERLGKNDRALADFDRALQINPQYTEAAISKDRILKQ